MGKRRTKRVLEALLSDAERQIRSLKASNAVAKRHAALHKKAYEAALLMVRTPPAEKDAPPIHRRYRVALAELRALHKKQCDLSAEYFDALASISTNRAGLQ